MPKKDYLTNEQVVNVLSMFSKKDKVYVGKKSKANLVRSIQIETVGKKVTAITISNKE